MATVEHVDVVRDGHWSARTISIVAALALDAGLVWLLYGDLLPLLYHGRELRDARI